MCAPEDGVGLSALWSLITCGAGREGAEDAERAGEMWTADGVDGIVWSRVSKYDTGIVKDAIARPLIPQSDVLLWEFVCKIEVEPADVPGPDDSPSRLYNDEERQFAFNMLWSWREKCDPKPTMREVFDVFLVMDRMMKPVIEQKEGYTGFTDDAPPRWMGCTLSLDELITDLWTGHVLFYGENTITTASLASTVATLVWPLGAAEVLDRIRSDDPSSEISAIRWTPKFKLVYRTIAWLLREQTRAPGIKPLVFPDLAPPPEEAVREREASAARERASAFGSARPAATAAGGSSS